MIAITIIISMSVKPSASSGQPRLPLRVRRSIGAFSGRSWYIRRKHSDRPNSVRLRIVLHAAHAPFARVGHRVERNAAQQLDLRIGRLARALHAVHQRSAASPDSRMYRCPLLPARACPSRRSLCTYRWPCASRRAPSAARAPASARTLVPRQRHRHGGEHQQDCERHDQFHQRHTATRIPKWNRRCRLFILRFKFTPIAHLHSERPAHSRQCAVPSFQCHPARSESGQ